MLFVPGDKEKLLLKSLGLGADAVIWDVEDAVAPAEKETARAAIGRALGAAPAKHVPIWVRINALGCNMLEADLKQVVRPHLSGVLFSKTESAEQVQAAGLDLEPAGAGERTGGRNDQNQLPD